MGLARLEAVVQAAEEAVEQVSSGRYIRNANSVRACAHRQILTRRGTIRREVSAPEPVDPTELSDPTELEWVSRAHFPAYFAEEIDAQIGRTSEGPTWIGTHWYRIIKGVVYAGVPK
jgi:hypothetical protein